MKKILGIVLVAVLCLGLFACEKKAGEEPKPTEEVETSDAKEEETTAGETDSMALKVVGTSLCDADGNPIQLRGISTHGIAWFPDYINAQGIKDLKDLFGINVLRVAMYTEEYNGYCSGADKEYLKQLVRDAVNYATQAGLYVIVDWHTLSDNNPLMHKDEAKDFFAQMSGEFAGQDNVLYEICNEPNNGTSWSDVKAYANEIIPVIRANDSDAVIIVGTPTWCQDVEIAADDPLTGYDNIMYSLHFYAATHKDDLRNKMTNALNKGLPIIVSEFGICDASGNGAIDEESANAWLNLINTNNISYVCWNLSNKQESSALINSDCAKTSAFSFDDLSAEGKWLYNSLKN